MKNLDYYLIGGLMMKIKTETIVRTVILIVALINQALAVSGHSLIPITDEEINEILTLLITVGASLWAWWKNNSFTQNAIRTDKVLDNLKKGE